MRVVAAEKGNDSGRGDRHKGSDGKGRSTYADRGVRQARGICGFCGRLREGAQRCGEAGLLVDAGSAAVDTIKMFGTKHIGFKWLLVVLAATLLFGEHADGYVLVEDIPNLTHNAINEVKNYA